MFTRYIMIRSPLSPEEASDRLKAVTIYTTLDPYDPKKALFRGTTGQSSFRISPLLKYGGGLFPWFRGTITEAENGSELRATARPLKFAKGFVLIWFGVLSFFLLLTLIAVITGKAPFLGLMGPLVILGGGAVLVYFGYTVPERKAEERLRKLLEAEQVISNQ